MPGLRALRSAAIAAALVACVSACGSRPATEADACSAFAQIIRLCGDPGGAVPEAVPRAVPEGAIGGRAQPDPGTPDTTTPDATTPEPSEEAYQRLTGPGGISVAVPATWRDSAAGASYRQVGEADPAGAFARFGGYPPTRTSLLAEITAGERGNPKIRSGYQRISLSATTFQGVAAVDWQFTFVKDGVTRHVHGLYWRTGGTEYLIYLSAPDVEWSALDPVFDVMRDSVSTP
ncbi:hypothetical protein [Labedaea rhizosphaerae]|uniref:Lipoprotein LpqN n=1 Tax=Labedaea rhizosphaerae TaxID=598644 RepID=A0A4R6SK56_LABRH|nr:hypothetical protein [Labedaea rhizosphaerae]TDQ01408.1 hypothetical protein EV186_1021276 [Labedaea rhizosphaerae]